MFYLMRDGPQLKPWFVGLFLPEYRREVSYLLNEIDEVWRLFLRVQIIIFVVLAILMLIGAGLVIWFYQLGLIPFSTLGLIGMLIIVYALVQQVDNLWLRPQMLGHQLKLHPGVVFVGLIAGLAVGNILGALVAVPLIATVKVLWHYVQHKITGTDPWPQATEAAELSAEVEG
jgi:predicted PurR-regulated permease PerM